MAAIPTLRASNRLPSALFGLAAAVAVVTLACTASAQSPRVAECRRIAGEVDWYKVRERTLKNGLRVFVFGPRAGGPAEYIEVYRPNGATLIQRARERRSDWKGGLAETTTISSSEGTSSFLFTLQSGQFPSCYTIGSLGLPRVTARRVFENSQSLVYGVSRTSAYPGFWSRELLHLSPTSTGRRHFGGEDGRTLHQCSLDEAREMSRRVTRALSAPAGK